MPEGGDLEFGAAKGGNTKLKDRNFIPLLWFLACCCFCIILLFVLAWIFYFLKFLSLFKETHVLHHTTSGKSIMDRSLKLIDYYDNVLACRAGRQFLPHPRSQEEEDELIQEINITVKANCEFVFFGFKADENVRYQSLSGDMTWRSLKVMPGGVLPFNMKDCYKVRFLENGSFSTEFVRNCGDQIFHNLLFLTISDELDDETCSRDSFKCATIYNSLPNEDVRTSFKTAILENPNLLTLVPFDKDQPPESLPLQKTNFTQPIIVMAVKYKFVYKHGNETQRYISSRFTVINPEFDCVAYDIKRDKIVTRNCEDDGCPVCVNPLTQRENISDYE